MGRDLAGTDDDARETFAIADDALGFPLSRLCFEGPEDELRLTENAQPAILTTSVAVYRAFVRRYGVAPCAVAGHSLGEWSALVAAGALDLGDAVRTVRLRGRLMQSAVPVGVGGMAAIMGLPADAVGALCREAADGSTLEPANLNGAGQVVVAGHAPAVDRLVALAKAAGGRGQRLAVSAPFHCALMEPAAEQLAPAIDALALRAPDPPVISTVEPRQTTEPEDIRRLLKKQVTAPVRWEEAGRLLLALRPLAIVECGPGRVLAGLLRRMDRDVATRSVGDVPGLAQVAGVLA